MPLHNSRPEKVETWLRIAFDLSQQGTCARRKVGCVLVDRNGDFLSSGYNGPPRGWPHCIETPCAGAHLPTGTGLHECEAVHAEANALIQCRDPYAIDTAYCTDSPCMDCVKLLLNTSCRQIVFLRPYTHAEAKSRWVRAPLQTSAFVSRKRVWSHYPDLLDRIERERSVA